MALLLLLSAAGITFSVLRVRSQTNFCGSDFAVFYAGGKLAGTTDLYSTERVQAIHQEAVGCYSVLSRFIRPPYYAFLFWPFAQFSFPTALFLWRLCTVAGTIACLVMWPFRWEVGLLICSWSVALDWNLMNGQDIVLILLCVTIGELLISRNRPFAGGFCFSICATKFHLLLLLPILLIQKRMWPALGGLMLGGLILLAVSFGTNGPGWPGQFLQAISDPGVNPKAITNIYGVFGKYPSLEFLVCVLVAIVAWYASLRTPFAIGLSVVLIAGCLTSRHQVPSDLALLIPAAGFLIREMKRPPWINLMLCLMLAPVFPLLAGKVEVLLMMAVLCGIAFCVRGSLGRAYTGGPRVLKWRCPTWRNPDARAAGEEGAQ